MNKLVTVPDDAGAAVEHGEIDSKGVKTLPPVLAGFETPAMRERTENFYTMIESIFESWINRRSTYHTQRTYRRAVMGFVEFMKIAWPQESWKLLQVTVDDVQAWRDVMVADGLAGNTINNRLSSLSGFYEYLKSSASELRLPVTIPNPAHSHFIGRPEKRPEKEPEALTVAKARRLLNLPKGESPIAQRDRAALHFYLFTGARISTGCRVTVADFRYEEGDSTVAIQEKGHGKSKRRVGLNDEAAEVIHEYVERCGLSSGPLFPTRRGARSDQLGSKHMGEKTMYDMLMRYLMQLPGSMVEVVDEEERQMTTRVCRYSPHSIRATTATVLLSAGVDIRVVQELLGHAFVTTTQIYDRRRRATKEGASHLLRV